MYNNYRTNECPYCSHGHSRSNEYNDYQCPYFYDDLVDNVEFSREFGDYYNPFDDEYDYNLRLNAFRTDNVNPSIVMKDYGPSPFVVDIDEATKKNNNFRSALWTGSHLQVTLMSINVGDDIGLELHSNVDQFIRVEDGQGIVKMGKNKDKLDFRANVKDGFAIMIPAGTWHNIINTGDKPLKVYSIYAPPQHPRGTVHVTKADAQAGEMNHRFN
ncbi:cupin domain-containing protein [Clostridium cylindrosporum]|uniref:Cupin type-2 domain-containing protein n=1 Tax=Clostridium cylindrosporum DSM 605 TaxID=1121307 RepID=A0A0J8DA39_CLOCY|nr:cupin domain-containing protein [Clostridium cylindrosporum]KMT21168.1 hypothetical protein CLCY_1c04020 [Clostridium cylindrosporum DSM 605]